MTPSKNALYCSRAYLPNTDIDKLVWLFMLILFIINNLEGSYQGLHEGLNHLIQALI